MTPREQQLEGENAHLRATVGELRELVAELRAQIEQQQATIDRLTRSAFGRSSERLAGPTRDAADAAPSSRDAPLPRPDTATPSDPPDAPTASATSTKRRSRHGRRRPSTELPVERVVIDLSEAEKPCPCCGELRVRVGTSVPSRRHDYRPAAIIIRETVRVSYACRSCEQAGNNAQFLRPPLPVEPLPRSSAASGLLAHVIVSKFVDHLPLYRQESMLARHGLRASRSTLCDWLRECAVLLDPLYRAMLTRVKQSYAIHVDDTPVSLLAPRRSAYAWVALGNATNPFVVFDLTAGRGQEHPTKWLAGFTGFVHADAYAGYNAVHGGERRVGCWMHVRRNFYELREQDPRAVEALTLIRTLYGIERAAAEQNLSDNVLSLYRQEHAQPVLNQFSAWLLAQQRLALPKSGFGQAVNYAVNQWPTLVRYASDGRLSPDNGAAERAIRPLAIGRKNWLFIGGDGGLSSAAVLLSACASARRAGVDPWAYLRDALESLNARPPDSDLSDLLPDRWKPTA